MKTEEQKYKLVQFSDNWADEMDIEGFVIITDKQWKDFKTKVKGFKKELCIAFGSNESNDYNNGEDLLTKINVKNITEDEANILKKLFGKSYDYLVAYGETGFIDQTIDIIEEQEEELEDEEND